MSLHPKHICKIASSLIVAATITTSVSAATLIVDPVNGPIRLIDMAALKAADGDTIIIKDGDYKQCAVWKASNITIKAQSPGKVIIHDQSCNGKGIFVISGNNVTVDGVMLKGARVADLNGAGIRFEGIGLTVRNVQFIDNENGILSSASPNSKILIENSLFESNGNCVNPNGCGHGIYIGAAASLTVRNSKFITTRQGHHIKSRATNTIVDGSIIDDRDTGTASYDVQLAAGGDGSITNNQITKGPRSENKGAVIVVGGEGTNPFTAPILISGNIFINKSGARPIFVRNGSQNIVRLQKNIVDPTAVLVTGLNSQR
jgi:Right handed beta helix region